MRSISTYAAIIVFHASSCGGPSARTEVATRTDETRTSELSSSEVCEGKYASGIRPGIAVGYLEQVFASGDNLGTADTVGEPCAGGRDRAACSSALAAARERAFAELMPSSENFREQQHATDMYRFIATRGDEVLLLSTHDALLAFMSPIDTVAEAAIVVSTMQISVNCMQSLNANQSTGTVPAVIHGTASHDGVTLNVVRLVQPTSCARGMDTAVATVARTGTVSFGEWSVLSPAIDICDYAE